MQSFEVKYPKIETLLHWTNLSLMFDIKRSFSRGMEVYKTQKNELIDRWILHKQSYMFYKSFQLIYQWLFTNLILISYMHVISRLS